MHVEVLSDSEVNHYSSPSFMLYGFRAEINGMHQNPQMYAHKISASDGVLPSCCTCPPPGPQGLFGQVPPFLMASPLEQEVLGFACCSQNTHIYRDKNTSLQH